MPPNRGWNAQQSRTRPAYGVNRMQKKKPKPKKK